MVAMGQVAGVLWITCICQLRPNPHICRLENVDLDLTCKLMLNLDLGFGFGWRVNHDAKSGVGSNLGQVERQNG